MVQPPVRKRLLIQQWSRVYDKRLLSGAVFCMCLRAGKSGKAMSKPTAKSSQTDLAFVSKAAQSPQLVKQIVMERPETEAELESRLRRDEADARLARVMRFTVFFVAVVLVLVVGIGGLIVLLNPATPPDLRDLAKNVLTALVTGFVGFLTGQATKKGQ